MLTRHPQRSVHVRPAQPGRARYPLVVHVERNARARARVVRVQGPAPHRDRPRPGEGGVPGHRVRVAHRRVVADGATAQGGVVPVGGVDRVDTHLVQGVAGGQRCREPVAARRAPRGVDVRPRHVRDERGALPVDVHVHLDGAGGVRVHGPAAHRDRAGAGVLGRPVHRVQGADRGGVGAHGGAEPVVVVVVEVPVAVRRAPVTGAVARRQRRGVGPVGSEVVQAGGRLVGDADLRRTARLVRVVQDVVDEPRAVAVAGRVQPVALQLRRCAVDLVEEARVVRVARRGVRAALPHRRVVVALVRSAGGDQPLLLLQHDQQDRRVDAATLGHLPHDVAGRLHRAAGVAAGAAFVPAAVGGALPVVLEARRAPVGHAARTLGPHERRRVLRAERVAVVEVLVADDVAGVELAEVGGRGHRRTHGEQRGDHGGEHHHDQGAGCEAGARHQGTSMVVGAEIPEDVGDV